MQELIKTTSIDSKKCPICNQWTFFGLDNHKCKPCFYVRIDDPEYSEQKCKHFVDSAKDAAIAFAAQWDCDTEAEIWNGEELKVIVIPAKVAESIEVLEEELQYQRDRLQEMLMDIEHREDLDPNDLTPVELQQEIETMELQLKELQLQSHRFTVTGEMVPSYYIQED